MPAAYAALQFKVFKVSGEVCIVGNTVRKIRRVLEFLAILIFTLATPLAIWKGAGQNEVVVLVAAVILLLRPDWANFRAISPARISRKLRRLVALPQRRKKKSPSFKTSLE